jgi:hypothetical protein
MRKIFSNQKGIAALVIVVVIASVTLLIAYGAAVFGLGELEQGNASQKSSEALSIANGCAEEALRHLRIDPNYTGAGLSLGAGSCIIGITANGNRRTIVSTGTVAEYNKKVSVVVTLAGNVIAVNTFDEVSN